jgi:hypothetical protein
MEDAMARPSIEKAKEKMAAVQILMDCNLNANQMARILNVSQQAMRAYLNRHNLRVSRTPNPDFPPQINVDNVLRMYESSRAEQ